MTGRRRRRATIAALGILTAGALALTGCAGSGGGADGPTAASADKPVRDGNLTVQIAADPQTLDANASLEISTAKINQIIFERLFALDAHYKVRPMLVKSYDESDDGLEYTFHLRHGISFSDGTPMTSADVVASIDAWARVNDDGKRDRADMKELSAPDEYTVVVKLKHRMYSLLADLSANGAPILKKAVAEKESAKGFEQEDAIGTGPYRLKSWKHGEKLVLERNPHYKSRHDKPSGYAGAKHAYLDTITFTVAGDPDAIVNGLKTGLWDYAWPSTDQYRAMKSDTSLVTHPLVGGNLNVIDLNMHKGLVFSSQKARDALNLAIDKKAINKVTGGSPDLTDEVGAYGVKGNDAVYSRAGKKEYEAYNPKKAKRLFAEAGITADSKPIRLLTTGEFPQMKQWATMIQQNLEKIGVPVTIKAYDASTMFAIAFGQPDKWDMMPLISPGDVVQARDVFDFTWLGYDSPELTALLKDYDNAKNAQEAKRVVEKLQALVWRDKPAIALSMTKPYASYTPKLKGYDDYWFAFWNSWLAK